MSQLLALVIALQTVNQPVYPQHLVDILWKRDAETNIDTLSIVLEIDADIPSECNLFIVPLCTNLINKEPFYLGVVTKIPECYDSVINACLFINRTVEKGRGSVFSRWNTLNINDLSMPKRSYLFGAVYDDSGKYISIRTEYSWKKGKYKFEVMKGIVKAGEPYVWYHAYIHNMVSSSVHYPGSLRFSALDVNKNGKGLGKNIYSFVELFYDNGKVHHFQPFNVKFSELTVNGQHLMISSAYARYNNNTYSYASVRQEDESVVVNINPEFKRINRDEAIHKIAIEKLSASTQSRPVSSTAK